MSVLFEDSFCGELPSGPALVLGVLGNVPDCIVVGAVFLFIWKPNKFLLALLLGILANVLINLGLKTIFAVNRPESSCLSGFSFPSGDAQSFAFFCGFVVSVFKTTWWQKSVLFFFLLVESSSRVALRHHFIADVVVGSLVGGFLGLIYGVLIKLLTNSRKQRE